MDGANINGLLSGLLQNPGMMESIMGILTNMTSTRGGSADVATEKNAEFEEAKADNDQNNSSEPRNAFSLFSNQNNNKSKSANDTAAKRRTLLLSLKPFLCKERCDKIDFILNVLTLLDMAQGLGITNIKI